MELDGSFRVERVINKSRDGAHLKSALPRRFTSPFSCLFSIPWLRYFGCSSCAGYVATNETSWALGYCPVDEMVCETKGTSYTLEVKGRRRRRLKMVMIDAFSTEQVRFTAKAADRATGPVQTLYTMCEGTWSNALGQCRSTTSLVDRPMVLYISTAVGSNAMQLGNVRQILVCLVLEEESKAVTCSAYLLYLPDAEQRADNASQH